MKGKLKKIFFLILDYYFKSISKNQVLLLIHPKYFSGEIVQELNERFRFYFSDEKIKLKIKQRKFLSFYFTLPIKKIKLFYGFDINNVIESKLKSFLFFDIDFNKNPQDGWNWHDALTEFTFKKESKHKLYLSKQIALKKYIEILPKKEKAFTIGTGPSLEKAIEIDWTDGYTIVCNTIVKDADLWNHIHPDFIVAGDAIYHFGHNDFAISFMSDLKNRLRETSTVFVYPFMYHAYLSRELTEFEDRLIPIPLSINIKDLVSISLLEDFTLPSNVGNVLNLLLLPLAITLSKNIFLYGFDGRAPDDKLFWANSNKHTYSDKISKIIEKHPKFFDFHVPKKNENEYVKKFHGDKLDNELTVIENQGWCFTMMHKTWTETLSKRIKNSNEL